MSLQNLFEWIQLEPIQFWPSLLFIETQPQFRIPLWHTCCVNTSIRRHQNSQSEKKIGKCILSSNGSAVPSKAVKELNEKHKRDDKMVIPIASRNCSILRSTLVYVCCNQYEVQALYQLRLATQERIKK